MNTTINVSGNMGSRFANCIICAVIQRLFIFLLPVLIFYGVGSAQTGSGNSDSLYTEADTIATNQNPHSFVDSVMNTGGVLSSGAIWTSVNPYPTGNTLLAVDIFRDTGCIAAGYLGSVISTTNRGGSWQTATGIGGATEGLFAVDVVDSLYVYMAGTRGVIMKSTDGGATWAKLISITNFVL